MQHPQWFVEFWNWIDDWKWFLTFVLAFYGATLATYREIKNWREKRANIKVHLSTSIIALDQGKSTYHVQVRIENHGSIEATFNPTCASIAIQGTDTHLLIVNTSFPVQWPQRLKHGESFLVLGDKKELLRMVAIMKAPKGEPYIIRAVVSDAIGRTFYSKWQRVKMDLTK